MTGSRRNPPVSRETFLTEGCLPAAGADAADLDASTGKLPCGRGRGCGAGRLATAAEDVGSGAWWLLPGLPWRLTAPVLCKVLMRSPILRVALTGGVHLRLADLPGLVGILGPGRPVVPVSVGARAALP